MTDGPFRNAKLSSQWKQYGKDLVNDAVSSEERAARACHSMLGDVDAKAVGSLLSALKGHAESPQIDLDPVSSAEAILERHAKSPLTDILHKHLIANLRDRMWSDQALDQALGSAVAESIAIAKNRLDEECVRARDLGDMNNEHYRKAIDRNRETFDAIGTIELCHALLSGSPSAFKHAIRKKAGVDEGPDE